MKRVVVSFLVSYDAEYLKTSLPLVYDEADKIVLSIDKDRRTWTGNKFELPIGFMEWIQKFDSAQKIDILEDNFYVSDLEPRDLDKRQRQITAQHSGYDNTWHIQIDADEYCLNFEKLVWNLRREEKRRKDCRNILYMGKWISLFKKDKEGFFYIDNDSNFETVPLAAEYPKYIGARKTDCEERKVFDVYLIHQTFARTEFELSKKLDNWTHSRDINSTSYLKLWKAIDRWNYKYLSNFHPTYAPTWKKLNYFSAQNLEEFIVKYKELYMDKYIISKPANKNKKPLKKRIWKKIKTLK